MTLTFHNDPHENANAINMTRDHLRDDRLIRGVFQSVENKAQGCGVGCLNMDLGNDPEDHAALAKDFGLPEWLIHMQDYLHESCGDDQFHVDLYEAIPLGVDSDLDGALCDLLVWGLVDPEWGVIRHVDNPSPQRAAVQCVADLIGSGVDWDSKEMQAASLASSLAACSAASWKESFSTSNAWKDKLLELLRGVSTDDQGGGESVIANPIQPGETLASVMDEFKRAVIVATISEHPTMASAARAMGVTRECLYKMRKRLGIEVPSQLKPIPGDWRERLETSMTSTGELR